VAAILDELGFWRDDITAANPAEGVINALLPSMATFLRHKLIKISTPYRKEGVLWRDYQQRAQLGYPVFQLSTAEMNPTISADSFEKARLRDPESFRREYLAEFTDQIQCWIPFETLDQCVTKSCTERPPVAGAFYCAAIDPAFKWDDFALAIAHRFNDGPIILDYTATWTGTREAPLGYEWVCREIADILQRYGLNVVVGDQHCAAIIQQEFLKLGIDYKEFTFGPGTRLELFGNLKHLLMQVNLVLLDKSEELLQLRGLEEHRTPLGNIDVRPAYGCKDDLAVVIGLVTFQLSRINVVPTPGFFLDEDPKPRMYVSPFSCVRAANCANMPACMDEGYCLGFIAER
jgi:hypothetical protein